MSLFISIATIIVFGVFCLAVYNEKDLTIVTSTEEDYFGQNDSFGNENGLRLAFTIATWRKYDPFDYYDFKLSHANNVYYDNQSSPVDFHKCSDEEIESINSGKDGWYAR